MIDPHEMESRFTYHRQKHDQPKRYEMIREQGKIMAECVDGLCPDSREKSIAMTKLEEAVMWANAAIARNE